MAVRDNKELDGMYNIVGQETRDHQTSGRQAFHQSPDYFGSVN